MHTIFWSSGRWPNSFHEHPNIMPLDRSGSHDARSRRHKMSKCQISLARVVTEWPATCNARRKMSSATNDGVRSLEALRSNQP